MGDGDQDVMGGEGGRWVEWGGAFTCFELESFSSYA